MFMRDEQEWAESVFGKARLGDKRRTRRLVMLAAAQARKPGLSVDAACGCGQAEAEGAHRLIRNHEVSPEEIFESGATYAADEATLSDGDILAIEDTTTLSFAHSVTTDLGDVGGEEGSVTRGWLVHSILLVSARDQQPLGLIEQERWVRESGTRGKKHRRRQRKYSEKESYKWQRASERMERRLGELTSKRVISVCDREADVYEYINYKKSRGQRFVVRASWNRKLAEKEGGYLWESLASLEPEDGGTVQLAQRGGRPKREAELVMRYRKVTLRPPKRETGPKLEPVEVHALLVREENPPEGVEGLEWLLLTSEEVGTTEQACEVLGYYRARWTIEDYHKAWKTGCRVEHRRQQNGENLERIAVITAFVGVRILQLRALREKEPETSCLHVLSDTEWKCLWLSIEGTAAPLPSEPPSVEWAYHTVGKLGGWKNSKRDGRVGWQLLWRGWTSLMDRVAGFEVARQWMKELNCD
jgi:hypothetical protein